MASRKLRMFSDRVRPFPRNSWCLPASRFAKVKFGMGQARR